MPPRSAQSWPGARVGGDGTTIKALNARDPDWADPAPPRTISWEQWSGTPAPPGTPLHDCTVTIYELHTC